MSDRAEITTVQTVTSKEQYISPVQEKEEAVILSHMLMRFILWQSNPPAILIRHTSSWEY